MQRTSPKLSHDQFFEFKTYALANADVLKVLTGKELSYACTESLGFPVSLGAARDLRHKLGWTTPAPAMPPDFLALAARLDKLEAQVAALTTPQTTFSL